MRKNKNVNESITEDDDEEEDADMIMGKSQNESSSSITDTDINEEDSSLRFEKLHCFYLYKKYIKEISLRMRQFKDELLASSLEFMLSLPKELIVLNLHEVFDALQVSLEMGINYLPMAENALTSLEYWLNNIPLSRLKPFYAGVLAKFDDYLQLNKSSESDELAAQEKVFLLKLNYKGRGKRKVSVKWLEKNRTGDSTNDEMYENIQFRILKILGQLAGEMSHCLFDDEECGSRRIAASGGSNGGQLISWDTNLHLKFYVPFIDIKPTIYFDRFIDISF